MTSRTTRIIATTAVLAGVAGTGAVLGTATAAATPADHLCGANEVTTSLVAGDPGAGQRYAYLQFTAKPDQGCSLLGVPGLSLAGAPGVQIEQDAGQPQLVTIADGQSATVLLHWTGIEAPAQQVTPTAATVTLPGGDGRPSATVTLPWNQGPMDSSAEAHAVTTGAPEPGAAPTPPQ